MREVAGGREQSTADTDVASKKAAPTDLVIRLYRLDGHGLVDDELDFSLSDFAGNLPAIGDQILHPLVWQGLSRAEPENREILTVVRRVFNPRDLKNGVALVCTAEAATEADRDLIPLG